MFKNAMTKYSGYIKNTYVNYVNMKILCQERGYLRICPIKYLHTSTMQDEGVDQKHSNAAIESINTSKVMNSLSIT